MEITAIVEEDSEGKEIVLVTRPPVTETMIRTFNERRGNHPDTLLQFRNGEIVVTHNQYVLWRGASTPGKPFGSGIAEQLSQIEAEETRAREEVERLRQTRFATMSKFFGVPVLSRNKLRNSDSLQ